VLVPLYEADEGLRVVLTRRSEGLRTHSGEVSFPGGRQDDGESLWETALREAHEEVGLDPAAVCPIGQLDRLRTVSSGSAIVPFVAALAGGRPDLAPNPHEVDEILHVSVDELLLDEVWREEYWRWPDENESGREITFFELVGDTIWGATAKMLRQLLSLGLGL
jgi:8-oxo-dGTP pyrophosphatase MutT (NUDIX family)